MILKRVVAISLISSMSLMMLILVSGLVLPASVTDRFRNSDESKTEVVALDENGQPIEGAKLQQNADGTQTVVDEDGQPLSGTEAPTNSEPTPPTPTEPAQIPSPTPTPSKPAPSIGSFTASPSSIAYGGSSTLNWSSSNATSCTMSPGGAVATSGSKSTGALTSRTTYTLTCNGNGTTSRQVVVSVAAAPPACGSPGGSCTSAQVATHNSPSNCWVIYGGSYYIITNYVNKHEGGTGAFTSSTCGHDISAYLSGATNAGTTVRKKKHSDAAYNILNSYKVGPVN